MLAEALDKLISSQSGGPAWPSISSRLLDPTLPTPSLRPLEEHELANSPLHPLHPELEVSCHLTSRVCPLTLCVQTQLKSFPFLIDAAMKWMSGPVSRQYGPILVQDSITEPCAMPITINNHPGCIWIFSKPRGIKPSSVNGIT